MKSTKEKWETAAELMARLNSDPEWVKKHEEREAQRLAAEARFRAEEEPILADLAAAGCTVNSVWDLVNTSSSYPTAIPVLLKHLRQPYHSRIREGIARALTVREARGTPARQILDELKQQADDGSHEVRWALANALTVAADASMTDEIEKLVNNPGYQDVQERLRTALKNVDTR